MKFLSLLSSVTLLLTQHLASAQADPPDRCATNPALVQRLNPVDSTVVCGQAGDLTASDPLIVLHNVFQPAVCALNCAGLRLQGYRHTCISFVHNPTSGNCSLFGALPVFEGFQSSSTSGSPRYVYNINCFETMYQTNALCNTAQIYNPIAGYPLMCGERGTIHQPQASQAQAVIPNVPTILKCAEECATAKLKANGYSCLSFSYNQQTRTCKTYYVAPFLLGITKNATSQDLYYNTQCFSSTNVSSSTVG